MLSTTRRLHHYDDNPFVVESAIVKPTTAARTLALIMNQDFSVNARMEKLMQTCFHPMRQISAVSQSLTLEAAEQIAGSRINSRVDYCNGLFADLLGRSLDLLQMALNAATRLVCGLHKFDHITPVLRDGLHYSNQ